MKLTLDMFEDRFLNYNVDVTLSLPQPSLTVHNTNNDVQKLAETLAEMTRASFFLVNLVKDGP